MKPVALRRPGRHLPLTLCAAIPILSAGCAAWGQTTELQPDRTVAAALSPGQTVRYTIDADENEFFLGEVDQLSVDVDIRILDPAGERIGQFGGLGQGVERFSARTESAGTHTVELLVAGDDEDAAGSYEITLLRHEPVATDPKNLADQMMARFDGPESPGAAVRVWRDGETIYSQTYGTANLTYGIPFAPDTRTNIGSTSKQFTAFAIMLQAERGLLSLDDDIRTHIPELPEFDWTIQVRHLVTHTSGLREFLNLLRMTGRRLDRGDWIDRSELIDIVQRQPALQNAPGAEWNYNNTAFGLAATIVERTSGQDFHVFMEENVFGPLDMAGSMVRPSPRHMVPNMSEGYTPTGDGYRQIGDLGGAVGAGSVYSTIGDLQTWIENYANPRVGTRASIDEMMTSFVLTDGEETGYGYGLFIDEQGGLKRVHHGGADVAHRSMLVYYPEINAGITTQSNHAQFDSDTAFELAEAFFADAMELEEEGDKAAADDDFDPDDFDPEDFDEFAGRYALDSSPAVVFTFTRDGSTFYGQPPGAERLEMVPVSDSTFRLPGTGASVTFVRGEDGAVEAAVLHGGGGDQRATRLADDAEEWEPGVEELADFAGRFFSDEIETFYTFTVEEGELVMHQRRLDSATLTPGEKDNFSGGGLSFVFERDRNREVIGFYLSNVRTRDVRFGRVR
ncbi:MAG: beta-lactamase family protein [Gemmatimonadetes bacterium]|nr:beta-lactamase family protein [Gemmatimonadota bacterium]MYE17119.1 beta-lactamase family protein [Gemmatimonadota bacterium]